jgi:CRISPR-associated protein Cst1
MSSLTLYPSNWLYNAGVIGLLRVLQRAGVNAEECARSGKIELPQCAVELEQDGQQFNIPLLAREWLLESWEQLTEKKSSTEGEKIKEVWGKLFNAWYRGFFNANTQYLFKASKKSKALICQFGEFVKYLGQVCAGGNRCSFCLGNSRFSHKNIFTSEHSKVLGASAGDEGVPNSFWNLNCEQSLRVCDLCSFVLISHHLALTRLSDGSEIFINAPSFQVMWYMNKFAREVLGSASSEEMRTKRTLLAMSVIEYATKIQATLGVWTGMNIEIVNKRGGQIEFFSLPYEVIQLLSDRRIAGSLSGIGEFVILNRVLDQDFSRLMELGYRLLRIGLKRDNERAKSENDFVNQTLRLEKNRRNPAGVAEQVFKLCAFIEEKRKRREEYEHIRFARS